MNFKRKGYEYTKKTIITKSVELKMYVTIIQLKENLYLSKFKFANACFNDT